MQRLVYIMPPKIIIKVDVGSTTFLKRFETIAKQDATIQINRNDDIAGYEGWQGLTLKSLISGPYGKLSSIIYSEPESQSTAFIEMAATKWHLEPPPREIYLEAVRTLYAPLIKTYNRKYQTRYRMKIKGMAVKERALPPETLKRLTSFVMCANKRSLHPNDWQRFYRFVAFCHEHRIRLSEARLRLILSREGFCKEKAGYLADIYFHCREILTIK